MTEHEPIEGGEFVHQQFLHYYESAKRTLSGFYFGADEAETFMQSVDVNFIEQEKGHDVPTCSYSTKTRSFLVNIEPETIENTVRSHAEDIDESPDDLLKLFVGAGVARSLLAWKTLPIKLNEDDPRRLSI